MQAVFEGTVKVVGDLQFLICFDSFPVGIMNWLSVIDFERRKFSVTALIAYVFP